jgi:hypothetical protein
VFSYGVTMKKFLSMTVALATVAISAASPANAAGLTTLTEGFTTVSTAGLPGWGFQNNSNPGPAVTTATANWFQGVSSLNAFDGAPTSYIGASTDSTKGGSGSQVGIGAVSNWLLTPELDFSNGGTFSFYTTSVLGQFTYSQFLEVRQSNNGASGNVGTTATSVGDFTTVNTTVGSLDTSIIYPGVQDGTTWTQFTFTVAPTGGSGRVAFRYFAPDGGVNGTQGGFVGIDAVSYTAEAVPEPSAALGTLMMGGFAVAGGLRNKAKKAKA